MITASHNPPDYNGMKFVRDQSKPISGDNGLQEIRAFAERGEFPAPSRAGVRHRHRHPWRPMSRICCPISTWPSSSRSKSWSMPAMAAPGSSSMRSKPHLPFEFIKVHHEPDGHFPNGIPNPMLEENRASTIEAIRRHGADFGIAWDGDFDRCFFFDEQGGFIEGYYIVGLLASVLLRGRARRQGGARSAADLEHHRGGQGQRRRGGAVQIRPCLHQAAHARGRWRLRRRDERAPLFPALCLLRQRHDSLAAGRANPVRVRPAAVSVWWASASACFPVSGELNYRVPDAKATHRCLRGALCAAGHRARPHRRGVLRICRTGASICAAPTPSP